MIYPPTTVLVHGEKIRFVMLMGKQEILKQIKALEVQGKTRVQEAEKQAEATIVKAKKESEASIAQVRKACEETERGEITGANKKIEMEVQSLAQANTTEISALSSKADTNEPKVIEHVLSEFWRAMDAET